ncbi:MAG: transposase [Elusimicrobia bacterium]|nr:transposase [Elusimicrobiota bacterium]
MARPPRVHFPGALYHVMARGNGGQTTFRDNHDYSTFLEVLSDVKGRKPFELYACCVMPNHFHFLMEAGRFPLSNIMQRLLTSYSRRFNIKHRRFGHVFQGRYKAILCQKDSYLLELLRYIHLNPVRAKMVRSPSDWRWSGHHAFSNASSQSLVDTKFPLSLIHPKPANSRKLYKQFILDGMGRGHEDDFYPSAAVPCLGSEDFISDYCERAGRKSSNEKAPNAGALERLAGELSSKLPLDLLKSPSRLRSVVVARHDFIRKAIKEGHSPTKIAAFLNRSPALITKISRQTFN